MMSDLSGKVAIVTGASSGIGRAVAVKLANLGCKLSLAARNVDNLLETKRLCQQQGLEENSVIVIQTDVAKNDDIKNMIDKTIDHFKQLDILVNNAGIIMNGLVDQVDMDKYYHLWDVNVHGVVMATRLAVQHLEKTKGCIVNVSSVNGIRPFGNVWAYCMTKSALEMFTKCQSIDLVPRGIRINNVNPGVIKTGIAVNNNVATAEGYAKFCENSRTTHALQRVAAPEEVADVVAFLVSDKSDQTSGASLLIDGGRAAMAYPRPLEG